MLNVCSVGKCGFETLFHVWQCENAWLPDHKLKYTRCIYLSLSSPHSLVSIVQPLPSLSLSLTYYHTSVRIFSRHTTRKIKSSISCKPNMECTCITHYVILYMLYCILYMLYCILYIVYVILYIVYCILYIVYHTKLFYTLDYMYLTIIIDRTL